LNKTRFLSFQYAWMAPPAVRLRAVSCRSWWAINAALSASESGLACCEGMANAVGMRRIGTIPCSIKYLLACR
jgi:hypothetical protein